MLNLVNVNMETLRPIIQSSPISVPKRSGMGKVESSTNKRNVGARLKEKRIKFSSNKLGGKGD
jgi:hypothetical protein